LPSLLINFISTHWVKSLTLQAFVNNLSAPCCVAYKDVGEGCEQDAGSFVALVKGIAINCERRLAEHAEMTHKPMFNCGFQVK
jgi:hypothetical protein